MRRFIAILTLVLVPSTVGAQALTVRDVIELSKAGLGEEAILALIEVNRPVFPVDVETLKELKGAGVRPTVVLAMIRSGRTPPPPPPPLLSVPVDPPPPPAPQVVVVEHHHEAEVRQVAIPVPVYVPVQIRSHSAHGVHHSPLLPTHAVRKPAEPVYWGWGGKRRPDAWQPAAGDVQKKAEGRRQKAEGYGR